MTRGASVMMGTETSVTDRYATQLFARVYGEPAGAPVLDMVRAVADARHVVQRQLTDSTDDRDHQLALLDEWSVVTVLAGSGSVPVVDPMVTAAPTRSGPRSVSSPDSGRPNAMADIQEARNEVACGEVIEGVDAVRALLSRP